LLLLITLGGGKHEDVSVVVCLVARERFCSSNGDKNARSVEEEEEGWCAFLFFLTFAFSIGFWITPLRWCVVQSSGRES